MSRRRYISTDISVDKLLNRVSEFAALLYSWSLPHARDDCRLPAKDPEEVRLLVLPGRNRTDEDVAVALDEIMAVALMGQDDDGHYFFPADSFYKYQSYIKAANRSTTPPIRQRKSAQNAGNQRKTPEISGDQRVSPENTSSLPLPLPLKEDEAIAAVDNFPIQPIPPAAASFELKTAEKGKEPWRPWADKIFASNRARFARMARFIRGAQSKEYPEAVIATGLERLWGSMEKGLVTGDWWPYAKTLMEKAYAEACQADSRRIKDEEASFLKTFLSSTGA